MLLNKSLHFQPRTYLTLGIISMILFVFIKNSFDHQLTPELTKLRWLAEGVQNRLKVIANPIKKYFPGSTFPSNYTPVYSAVNSDEAHIADDTELFVWKPIQYVYNDGEQQRFAVFGATVPRGKNDPYSFFLPLTARAWKRGISPDGRTTSNNN